MPGNIAALTAEKRKELQAKGLSGAALDTELANAKRQIESRAGQETDREITKRQSDLLASAMGTAKQNGDQDMIRSIEEQYKKNPQLRTDKAEMAKDLLADKKALNGMSDQAKGDVATLYALMGESGAVTRDKDGNATGVDRVKMESFKDKITDKGLLENVDMVERYINGQKDAAGRQVPVSKAFLDGASIGKNEKGKTRMFQKGQMGAVSSMRESQAKNAFTAKALTGFSNAPADIAVIEDMIKLGSAEDVFKNASATNTYMQEAQRELAAINVDAWDPEEKDVTKPGYRDQASVETALKKFEALASKIDDMNEAQQERFANEMGATKAAQAIIKAKRAGFSAGKSRTETHGKALKLLVNLETNEAKTGRPAPPSAKTELSEVRQMLQEQKYKGVPNSYKKMVEPDELT